MNEPVKKPLTPEELKAKFFSNRCADALQFLTLMTKKFPAKQAEQKAHMILFTPDEQKEQAAADYEKVVEWLIENHNVSIIDGDMITIDDRDDRVPAPYANDDEDEFPINDPESELIPIKTYRDGAGIRQRIVDAINTLPPAWYTGKGIKKRLEAIMLDEDPESIHREINDLNKAGRGKYRKLISSGIRKNSKGVMVKIWGPKSVERQVTAGVVEDTTEVASDAASESAE